MTRSHIGLGLVLVCFTFSLTACSGRTLERATDHIVREVVRGGLGGNGQTCPDGSPIPDGHTCPTPTPEEGGNARPAARASPKFGSVTQGSNVLDGMTTDSVSMAYLPHGGGFHPVMTIRTGDGTVLTSNADPTQIDVELSSGSVIHVDPTADWRAGLAEPYTNYHAADVYELPAGHGMANENAYLRHPRVNRAIDGVRVSDILDDSIAGPRLYTAMSAFGYTDYPSATAAGDDDYVSWGAWVYFTITPSALDLALGAFADGVKTPSHNIPITGIASYSGYTSGMAIRGDTPTRGNPGNAAYWNRTLDFLGRVHLQADFAKASVRGRVDNFQAQEPDTSADLDDVLGENGFLKNLVIDLGDADLASGTFQGDTRVTAGLAGAVGKWGGQFFGTSDNGDEAPPAAGGTWGVTQGAGDDNWKMIGGFGAWRP